ncbi:MAG: hypothetical protein COB17_05150 [Sulfurimonas sp.]|nr:MAG: hypothetical protein COB17_05150 [Sulfurimonas sp.]
MIDAEVRSEEKFSKLSLAYSNEEEKQRVHSCVKQMITKSCEEPETYTCSISNDREVLVIEYQDDTNRQCGDIFEEIIKALDIKKCD